MNSDTSNLTVTYFPYTFVNENDLKSLLLYFDILRLLHVIPGSDPGLPEIVRSSQLVQCFHPLSDATLLEHVRKAHQSYLQLRSFHQNGGSLQLLQTSALQENFEDSRPGLVAQIRQAHPRLAPDVAELINDAVFILLSHQLDHENLELDRQLEQIRGLEARFREQAGIGTDEEREAAALRLPPVEESDPPPTQYVFQRLRAWTRLYCLQEETTPFLPLTTSGEVAGEIAERLPSTAHGVKEYNVSALPDPELLSLEEVLKFRQALQDRSLVDTWRGSVLSAIHQLQETILEDDHWRKLEQNLQEAAAGFQQHWPLTGKPSRYLRLKFFCYPNVQPEVAFSKVTGLEPGRAKKRYPTSGNGITLLLSPAQS